MKNNKLGIGIFAFLAAAFVAFGWVGRDLNHRDKEQREQEVDLTTVCEPPNQCVPGELENEVRVTEPPTHAAAGAVRKQLALALAAAKSSGDKDGELKYQSALNALDSIGIPRSYVVRCPSIDAGSTIADIRIPFDGGVNPIPMLSFTLSSTSTTCVRVSGTDVTSATGQAVGSGCANGMAIGWDAKVADCKSTAASVDVMVTTGQ